MAVFSGAPTPRTRIASFLRGELQPSTLVRSLAAGLLIYILQLIITISFAALIFAQDSGSFVLRGLGFLLAGNAVMGVVLSLTSSWSGTISLSQDAPVAAGAANIAGAWRALHRAITL